MPRQFKDTVAVLGIDIGKNTFHLIGLGKHDAIVLRLKLSRGQVEARLANLPPCLIGMEACVGAHHLSRRLKALGHDPSLMPASMSGPFERATRTTSEMRKPSPRRCYVRPCGSSPSRRVGTTRSPGAASGTRTAGLRAHSDRSTRFVLFCSSEASRSPGAARAADRDAGSSSPHDRQTVTAHDAA